MLKIASGVVLDANQAIIGYIDIGHDFFGVKTITGR